MLSVSVVVPKGMKTRKLETKDRYSSVKFNQDILSDVVKEMKWMLRGSGPG
jgi:hypothetical protein